MNLNKFFKKNYKKIIVVCLIMLLFSNKMYENFTPIQALDGVKATEKKVNDMFYKVDKDWVRTNKNIYSSKEIKAKTIRSTEDVIATRNMTATGNVNAKKDVNASGKVNAGGDVKGKRLCIGRTCLSENHLKMITQGFKLKLIAGKWARNDDKTSGPGFIHSHSNHRLGEHGSSPAAFKLFNK